MVKHEDLLRMIAHVRAIKEEGRRTASISAPPSFFYALGVPMEYCAMSAVGINLVCIMDTERLLAALEKRRVRYEN